MKYLILFLFCSSVFAKTPQRKLAQVFDTSDLKTLVIHCKSFSDQDLKNYLPLALKTQSPNQNYFRSETILHYAAANCTSVVLEELVKAGADINAPGMTGYTPIFRAIKAENFEAVKKLVELKANLSPKNKEGENLLVLFVAIEMAEKFQDLKILEFLLENNASVHLGNQYYKNALVFAEVTVGYGPIVDLIKKYK
jgi:hypothetical protein